jgi:hypothetical protein
VIWATWQLFLHVRYDDPRRGDPTIPSEFEARVKKCWAFGVPIPPKDRPGTGTSIRYEPYHAFELAIALTLMDLGLPQAEAAQFVIGNRSLLRRMFPQLQGGEATFLTFRLQEIREGRLLQFPRRSIYVGLSVRAESELAEDLKKLRGHGLIVLEIGGIAARVVEYLRKAPEIRRGRP